MVYNKAGIQFWGQATGHMVAWRGTDPESKGFIRSDATNDDGGSVIFTDGGVSLQGHTGAALATAFVVDAVTDANNPISLKVAGATAKVTAGADDSGGAGYKVLRVPN
jgi:hypothetical protein